MPSKLSIALFAAIASLFNLNVGGGDLRVTLGVVILIVGLHIAPQLEVMSTSALTGITVFLTRVLVSAIAYQKVDMVLVVSYAIEILFYVAYGFFYKYIVLNDKNETGTPLMLLLMLCDFGANTVEYLIRFFFYDIAMVQADFVTIFLAAFIRSAIIWLILKFIFNTKELRTSL